MLKQTWALLLEQEQRGYKNPKMKIKRLVRDGKLIRVRRGLYETDPHVDKMFIAGAIYGPSYISFYYALAYYGLIPEWVYECTSATMNNKHRKEFDTVFGRFTYQSVPANVFPLGVLWHTDGEEYSYQIATPEKALCDMLYIQHPVRSISGLNTLMFENLRIDFDEFTKLNKNDLLFLASKYNNSTLNCLISKLRKEN